MRYARLVDHPWNARLALTTAPASEPVSIDELRAQTRIDVVEDLNYLAGIAQVSRQWVEHYLGRQLITATWTMTLDKFPEDGVLEVPRPPLLTVSSVKYYDADRAQQTFAAAGYNVHTFAGPGAPMGRIELASGYAWPTVYSGEGAVQVAFTAGYGADGAAVPPQIKQAILMHAAELYERREQLVVGVSAAPVAITVERLLWPLRAV